jgi:tetraacyldisaccharide-1-P 4'-kinase
MIVERTGATSLLVTSKDLVKMSAYKKLNLSILELSITLDEALITTVKDYVNAAKN